MEVKKTLGLFPYNRGYWSLALPATVTIVATVALRIALRSATADIPVVVLCTAIAYALFLGTVLIAGLNADDRLIASAVWYKVRNSFPDARSSHS